MNDEIGLFAIDRIRELSRWHTSPDEIQARLEFYYPLELIEKYMLVKENKDDMRLLSQGRGLSTQGYSYRQGQDQRTSRSPRLYSQVVKDSRSRSGGRTQLLSARNRAKKAISGT